MTFFHFRTGDSLRLWVVASVVANLRERNSATQTNDSTTMTFVRKLDTGDKYDHKIGSSDINVIWAHGSDGDNSFGSLFSKNNFEICTGITCP
jgi:hypothetical protein